MSARPSVRLPWLAFAGIAAVAGGLALAFAWTAGWIGSGRLTPRQMVDAIEANNPEPYPGYRRAHSKGVCVVGVFHGSGAASGLSTARVFVQRDVPVLGRMSIAGADPHGPDNAARVRSMALLLRTDDGQQWRTAMNDFPFFPVATPQGFHAQMLASRPDPATGKPDPARMAAFLEQYPEVRRFQAWAGQAPWTTSWANTQFNGVNAFFLRNGSGRTQAVRWSMQPLAPVEFLSPEQRNAAGAQFLATDLSRRLAQQPLRWNLVLTLAGEGDPVDDPSQPWPEGRQQLIAGTLELTGMSEQATGACRDINYDPLILPAGIEPSDDPVLLARSAVYAQSYDRREWEIARGMADEAVGRVSAP